MKRLIFPFFMVLSVGLVALGFNTLDWIVNTHFWKNVDGSRLWHLNTYVSVEVWNGYFFFGIVPFAVGFFLLGCVVARHWDKELSVFWGFLVKIRLKQGL